MSAIVSVSLSIGNFGIIMLLVLLLNVMAPGESKAFPSSYGFEDMIQSDNLPNKLCTCSQSISVSPETNADHNSVYESNNFVAQNLDPEPEQFQEGYENFAQSGELKKDNNPNKKSQNEMQTETVPKKVDSEPNVIKQVIFIEPPQYFYNQLNIEQSMKKQPKIRIYVFPPKTVKHSWHITDNRMLLDKNPPKPIVYYLMNMDEEDTSLMGQMQMLLDANQNPKESYDQNQLQETPDSQLNSEITPELYNEDLMKISENMIMNSLQFNRHNFNAQEYSESQDLQNSTKTEETINDLPQYINSLPENSENNSEMLNSSNYDKSISNFNEFYAKADSENVKIKNDDQYVNDKIIPRIEAFEENNYYYEKYSSPRSERRIGLVNDQTNYYENDQSEKDTSNFEILPAILQRHFYIGPDGHYTEIPLNT